MDSKCGSVIGSSASNYYYSYDDSQDDTYSYYYAKFDDEYSTTTESSAKTQLCSNTTTAGVTCSGANESDYMYYLSIGIIIAIVIAVLCCVGMSFFAMYILTNAKVLPSNVFFRQPPPVPAFAYSTQANLAQVQPVDGTAMGGSVPLITIRNGPQTIVRAYEDGTPPTFNPVFRNK